MISDFLLRFRTTSDPILTAKNPARQVGFGRRRASRIKRQPMKRRANQPITNTLIEHYCRIANEAAEIEDPRLEELRGRMTRFQCATIVERLRSEAADAFKEAELLRARLAKLPTNDN